MLIYLLVLTFTLLLFEHSEAKILKPEFRCVPTATVHGPCHDCVCSADGVFHCKSRECYAVDLNKKRSKQDCKPKHLYREDATFCTCSDEGHWRSDNCQAKFRFLHPNDSDIVHVSLRTKVYCEPDSFYILDCNVCRCHISGVIYPTGCTNRVCYEGRKADACQFGDILRTKDELCSCSDINVFIDRMCLPIRNLSVLKVQPDQISKLVVIGHSWRRIYDMIYKDCHSDTVYTVDCNDCICDQGYLVCTKKTCEINRKIGLREQVNKNKKEFDALPELPSDEKCIPGKTYRSSCNTCRCMAGGVPSCATMMCLKDFKFDDSALRKALTSL